jgi:hypothetical protein
VNNRFFVALLISSFVAGCSNLLPRSEGEKSSGYAYVPLDPLPVETVPGQDCQATYSSSAGKLVIGDNRQYQKTLLSLPDNAVRIAIRQIDASTNLSFGASSIGTQGNRYQVVLDYINVDTSNIAFALDVDTFDVTSKASVLRLSETTKDARVNSIRRLSKKEAEIANQEPSQKRSEPHPSFNSSAAQGYRYSNSLTGVYIIPVYVGVGLRLTADIQVISGTVNLSSLASIAASIESKSASGSLVVQTLGITGPQVSTSLPLPSELNQTTVQNAILSLGSIKAIVSSDSGNDLQLTPRVTGIYLPIDNGTQELVNRIVSELARSPIPWERSCTALLPGATSLRPL